MSDFTFGAFRPASRPTVGGTVAAVLARVGTMLRARATRRMLADMDDRLLADIGVGRGDAVYESRRPMWDLAQTRR